MTGRLWVGVALLCVATTAGAQGGMVGPGQSRYYPYGRYGQPSAELTIEEQRELGLSDEQIRQIAEARRDVEKEREKIEEQLKAAQAAASAANAQVSRLNGELRTLLTVRIRKIHESVMTPEQLKAWKKQQHEAQAKQWLRGYMQWLKLTDAQVEDIAQLLLPVYEKYDKMQDELEAAKEQLSGLRKADPIDIEAISQAEKRVAELSKVNVYTERHKELQEAMRAGLMPDQLEKLDRLRRR